MKTTSILHHFPDQSGRVPKPTVRGIYSPHKKLNPGFKKKCSDLYRGKMHIRQNQIEVKTIFKLAAN